MKCVGWWKRELVQNVHTNGQLILFCKHLRMLIPQCKEKELKPLHDKAVGQICIHNAIYRMSSDLHPFSDKKYVTHNLKAGLNSNGLFEALIDKLM